MSKSVTQDEILPLIGRLIITFAYAEQSLEFMCAYIMRQYDGEAKREWPVNSLAKRLQYFENSASKVIALNAHKEDMKKLVVKFDQLSEIRHGIVHGALKQESLKEGKLIFRRQEIESGQWVEKDVTILWEHGDEVLQDFLDLAKKASDLLGKIVQ